MKIDVISYTDEQFAALSAEQIVEVKSAQVKKNRLAAALAENKRKEKFRLLKAGIFRSPVWGELCAALQAAYDAEIENLRDGLLFYLRFTGQESAASAPYPLDYGLTYEKRLAAVRTYYEAKYSVAAERFAAFREDAVAKSYLGEYYAPLYELYYAQAQG